MSRLSSAALRFPTALSLLGRLQTHWQAHGLRSLLSTVLRRLEERSGLRYLRWRWQVEPQLRLTTDEVNWLRQQSRPPRIAVLVPVCDPDPEYLRQALRSLQTQLWPPAQVILIDDASTDPRVRQQLEQAAQQPSVLLLRQEARQGVVRALNQGLATVAAEWLAVLDHDDVLPCDALARIAQAILQHPQGQLFYTDEDQLNRWGLRCNPFFKPDWDELRFWGQNYLNHLVVAQTQRVQQVGGFAEGTDGSQDYALWLRLLRQPEVSPENVVHVLGIGYHWRQQRQQFSQQQRDRCATVATEALQNHLRWKGLTAEVTPLREEPTWRQVRLHPRRLAEVAVVIPTRDRLELLRPCVQGLLDKTDYPALQVWILDNDSAEPETLTWLQEIEAQDPRVRVRRCPGPFHYARLHNQAVAEIDCELLLLLNNDTEVTGPLWLRAMVGVLELPDYGAVGARLLYPNQTLQHGGVIVGMGGVAGHDGWHLPTQSLRQIGRYQLLRQVSANTAACLLLRRDAWDQMGGFREELAIAFNDVDLCLRLQQAGWRIAWCPQATLLHWESASRGSDEVDPQRRHRFQQEIQTMQRDWGPQLRQDPFYHPWLSLETNRVHQVRLDLLHSPVPN